MAHVLTLIIHCERVCGQVSKFRDECSPESKHIHINSYPLKNECMEDDIPFGKVRFHRTFVHLPGIFGIHGAAAKSASTIHRGSVCPLELLGERKLAEVVSYPSNQDGVMVDGWVSNG